MCNPFEDVPTLKRLSRRRLLAASGAAASFVIVPVLAATDERSLAFYHTHTRESLRVTYTSNGGYIPQALEEINHFLRDFRTDDVQRIDPRLLDALHALRARAGGKGTYEIISAYRSPRTNEMLRNSSNGVVERSLHMEGKAIDVRLRGMRVARLREEALALRVGGVGYYPESQFVHVDTGRVRYW